MVVQICNIVKRTTCSTLSSLSAQQTALACWIGRCHLEHPPEGPKSMKLSVWSFVSGVLWGISSGVGLMMWLLIKLLKFQRKELERRHAWLRWSYKYKNMRREVVEDVAQSWSWENLDDEFKLLLTSVDNELAQRDEQRMTQEEVGCAIRTLLQLRDDTNARFAIAQAVRAVHLYRKGQLPAGTGISRYNSVSM